MNQRCIVCNKPVKTGWQGNQFKHVAHPECRKARRAQNQRERRQKALGAIL